MHKAKEQIARAAGHLRGMERKKFLAASSIVVAFALVVVGAAIIVSNTLQPAYSPETTVVIGGQVACLPHKDTNGTPTAECALGLHSDDNRYYALQGLPQPIGADVGAHVTVKGTFTTTNNTIYDVAGTIKVNSLMP